MRRTFLTRMLALPALGLSASPQQPPPKSKILIKSAWGSADPTQASFPFHHANAFAAAGHEVQIFLLGEAVSLMRATVLQCCSAAVAGQTTASRQPTSISAVSAYSMCSTLRGFAERDFVEAWTSNGRMAITPPAGAEALSGRTAGGELHDLRIREDAKPMRPG